MFQSSPVVFEKHALMTTFALSCFSALICVPLSGLLSMPETQSSAWKPHWLFGVPMPLKWNSTHEIIVWIPSSQKDVLNKVYHLDQRSGKEIKQDFSYSELKKTNWQWFSR